MTKEEIESGNRIIAEFMELKEDPEFIQVDEERKLLGLPKGMPMYILPCGVISNLRYNFSMDWLYPACKKWDELNIIVVRKRQVKSIQLDYIDLSNELDHLVACYEIEPVFQHLVKCVEWYNLNVKK